MKVQVPPAPLEEADRILKPKPPRRKRTALMAPLDPGFVSRTYVTTLWAGVILTLCVASVSRSATITGSFVGGVLLGVLLLKSQELFVNRVIAPRNGKDASGAELKKNLIARIPIALLLPLKYLIIGMLFAFVIERGWLHPIAFTAGFLAEQLVIVSKVVGRFLDQRLNPKDMNSEDRVGGELGNSSPDNNFSRAKSE